jgi:hypothetical protein
MISCMGTRRRISGIYIMRQLRRRICISRSCFLPLFRSLVFCFCYCLCFYLCTFLKFGSLTRDCVCVLEDIVDMMLTSLVLYRGSAVQQTVSALTILPDDMFQGSGQQFHTIGKSILSSHNTSLTRRLSFVLWCRLRILHPSKQRLSRIHHLATRQKAHCAAGR